MIKVLLTSTGFENPNISYKFLQLVAKEPKDIKVIWVPTAANSAEAKSFLPKCMQDLTGIGILEENITIYDCDRVLSANEFGLNDAIYFCGGSSKYLLKRINKIELASPMLEFVKNGGVYVGVSAGSIVAASNLKNNLGHIDCELSVHASIGDDAGVLDMTMCSKISVADNQAILRVNDDYILID